MGLENGKFKMLFEVSIGDRVQVVKDNGSVAFSPVVFIPHQKENSMTSRFLTLSTQHTSIKVTPSHFLLSGECDEDVSEFELQFASKIALGSCLVTVNGKETVSSISLSHGYGIQTLVVAERTGLVVVNGIVASSFASLHTIPNTLYNIHRLVYSIFPRWMQPLENKSLIRYNSYIGDSFLSIL